jgi:succinyl-diaminopimelate desuccinylase
LKTENGALELSVNARFPYGANVNEIIDCFQEITGEFGGEIVHTGILPAVYVSKEKPFIKAFVDAYDQVSGRKNEFVLAYGGSYAKAMPNIVSWGPIFPGDEDTCHEENEYISISCLMDNAKIFAAAVSSIVLSADSYK